MNKIPNPGSDKALSKGCLCPVMDNYWGEGSGFKDLKGNPVFWYSAACNLHYRKEKTNVTRKRKTKKKGRKQTTKRVLKKRTPTRNKR